MYKLDNTQLLNLKICKIKKYIFLKTIKFLKTLFFFRKFKISEKSKFSKVSHSNNHIFHLRNCFFYDESRFTGRFHETAGIKGLNITSTNVITLLNSKWQFEPSTKATNELSKVNTRFKEHKNQTLKG